MRKKIISAEMCGNLRKTAEMCASPSPSPSLSREVASAPSLRARAGLNNDLGLGDRHPAALCGWDLWRRLQSFWELKGKRLTIFQFEMSYKLLSDAKNKGQDPVKIVEKAIRAGWMDLYDEDKTESRKQPPKKPPAPPQAAKMPPPSPDEIAKAKRFLKELIEPVVKRKSIMVPPNIDERKAMLRRQAIQLGGGP